MNNIIKELFKHKDEKYKRFNSKLIPNIDRKKIIGVKIPDIRKIYKMMNSLEKDIFINNLPHEYHEENLLHAIILSNYKTDVNELLKKIDQFLPYIDNWAVCDILSFKIFLNNKELILIKIEKWINSKHEYTVRFAIVILLKYYLNDKYINKTNNLVLNINKKEYYINMAIAWYFSYALIYQYNTTIIIFENKILNKWLHNKSIQKAIESYRIPKDKKEYLKTLKIK